MATFILRAIDPALWARVLAKATTEGITPKQLILKAIAQYVALVAVVAGAVFMVGCSGSTLAATPTPVLPKAAVDCRAVGTLPCQQGQPPAPEPPTPGPTTVTLSGTVTDGTSGGALPNISVAAPVGIAHTDSAGRYQIVGLPTGFWSVTFSASGYDAQTQTVTVSAGMAGVNLDAVLKRIAGAAPVTPAPIPSPVPTPPVSARPGLALTLTCGPAAHSNPTFCNYGAKDETGANVTTATGPADWDFGDGSVHDTHSTTMSQHTYSQAGTYVIAVSTMGEGGRRGSASTTVVIP